MSSVILDGLESENPIGNTLKKLLEEKNEKFFYFQLKDMKIMACRSCGSCGLKTPGECVLNDQTPEIMKAIAPSNRLVMLTPIRFGGYSSQLKKAVDKFMLLGLPLYIIRDGHLLHPMRYGKKSLLVIGVSESNSQEEEENFRTLVARNGLNMQANFQTLILKSWDSQTRIAEQISNALGEGDWEWNQKDF